MRNQSAWCGGSRLARGSSISSTCACTASARARSTRWRSPPESWPSGRSRQSQACVARSACSTAAWSAALGAASQAWCGRRPSIATSQALRSSAEPSLCPSQASCRARCRPDRACIGEPSRRTSPVWGNSPPSTLSNVDLPAPLGPTMQVQRPAGRERSSPCRISTPPSAARTPSVCKATALTPPPWRRDRGASATAGSRRPAPR